MSCGLLDAWLATLFLFFDGTETCWCSCCATAVSWHYNLSRESYHLPHYWWEYPNAPYQHIYFFRTESAGAQAKHTILTGLNLLGTLLGRVSVLCRLTSVSCLRVA